MVWTCWLRTPRVPFPKSEYSEVMQMAPISKTVKYFSISNHLPEYWKYEVIKYIVDKF